MDIDKPLDDIIDQKRKDRKSTRGGAGGARGGAARGGRGGRGGGGGARGGAAAGVAAPTAPAAAAGAGTGPVRNRYSGNIAASRGAGAGAAAPSPAAAVPLMADGSKIIVSNLPTDVTENQIRDLFTQTVGPVTRIQLSYDKNGKSTGVANIELRRAGDGQVAFQQYNARLVDGSKPMKVEIVFDPTRLPPAPLSSRVAPAAVVPVVAAAAAPRAVAASGQAAGGALRGGGRGRGGRGRGRGGKRSERPAATEADLDAEMEDYQKNLATA